MEQFLSQIPTTFIGWITTVLIAMGSVSYIFSQVRQRDMQVLRESNQDLRSSIEDKGREINMMHAQITTLNEKVALLEKANRTLEDLVVTALKQYFFENPTVAGQLKKSVVKEE